MDSLTIYDRAKVLSFVNQRVGESKLGEQLLTVASLAEIETSAAAFVLVGIPEDVGVRANHGIGGTKTAWQGTLKALLNMQSNSMLTGSEILLLGHFEIAMPEDNSIIGLRKKTAEVDALVGPVVEKILLAGKIPIVIGGGHNNAFPLVKALHVAKSQAVNVVNIDAHADLRNPGEGRHSGNPFSTAIEQHLIDQYFVFGLHQNYVHREVENKIAEQENINVCYFDDILISSETTDQIWKKFTSGLNAPCGLEIDLDSIANTLSSATSPSGFSLNEIRRILLNNRFNFNYLHICEGATALVDGRQDVSTGKAIAYLITDFVKALRPHISPPLSS